MPFRGIIIISLECNLGRGCVIGNEKGKNLIEILEKKKLWLGIYIAVAVVNMVVKWSYALFFGVAEMPTNGFWVYAYLTMGIMRNVLLCVYYVYRLLYLYKSEPKRMKWTILTVLGFGLVMTGYFMKTSLSVFTVTGRIISICCWLKDFVMVFLS